MMFIHCKQCQFWVEHGNSWGDCSSVELFSASENLRCLAEVVIWRYDDGQWCEVDVEDVHAGLRTHADFGCPVGRRIESDVKCEFGGGPKDAR